MMESLENLKVGDDVIVYDKNSRFEAIFYKITARKMRGLQPRL